MGTYSNSNFGRIKGKVGEGVGSKWRGVKVLRSLPTKSSKPATVAQLAVHARFALAAAQLSPIKDVLNLGFNDKKLNKTTGYNAAVKTFLAQSITGDYPNYAVDFPSLTFSKGSLSAVEITMSAESQLFFSWPEDLNDYTAFASDKITFIIYNETKNTYKVRNNYFRSDIEASMHYPGKPGDKLHFWAFCVKNDGRTVSPSQYIGMVTVPEAESI